MVSRDQKNYIPTLDGWRAIAVTGVILFHTSSISIWGLHLRKLQDLGIYGVSLFFAISGLLICGRLLDEEESNGKISLRGFYLRRIFRIQPPAVVFLLILAVLGTAGILSCPLWPWVSSLLSFRNFYTAFAGVREVDRYTHHFWSLSIEEHFYLILPLLLIATRRWRLVALGTLSIVSIVWVFEVRHYYLPLHPAAGERTDLYAAALLFPATVAYLIRHEAIRMWITRWSPLLAVLSVSSFFVSALLLHNTLIWLIAICGFPLILLSTVLHPQALVSRALESRPLKYVGRISYSIYLWQQLFFVNYAELASAHEHLRVFQIFPLNLVLLFAAASSSYFLIERPMMRVGRRLAVGHGSTARHGAMPTPSESIVEEKRSREPASSESSEFSKPPLKWPRSTEDV